MPCSAGVVSEHETRAESTVCRHVVCCVVLFLLCICVCGLFLFLQGWSPSTRLAQRARRLAPTPR